MIVIDVYSRRIVGFPTQASTCTGPTVCRMLNEILANTSTVPIQIGTDNDPLFRFHRWEANLRIHGIEEIKTVPEIPCSHPFVERAIGSVRRECVDQTLFWNGIDLQPKLDLYQEYFNEARVHHSLDGVPPNQFVGKKSSALVRPENFRWKKYCFGLYAIPVAA